MKRTYTAKRLMQAALALTLSAGATSATAQTAVRPTSILEESISKHNVIDSLSRQITEAKEFFPEFSYLVSYNSRGEPVSVTVKGVDDEIANSLIEARIMDVEMLRYRMRAANVNRGLSSAGMGH